MIFELKRGTLTGEAIAQILDYASDLNDREIPDLARLVKENSGRMGIEAIDDFLDWYDWEYPNGRDELAKSPRMVLVGLCVDDGARRMVEFLAISGLDIQLLTFHAFSQDGAILLARQVETVPVVKKPQNATATKEGSKRILLDAAFSLGCRELLEDVASLVSSRLP